MTLGDVQRTQRLKFWIGSRLAELAAFHQPLAKHRRERAEALDADYPDAVELEPGEDLSCKGAWVELGKEQSTSYLPSGYVLEELPDGSPIPSPVAAGLLAIQQMGIRGPLLVVLDIDLTHPDMGFLGLSGNRLRICDHAEPPDDDEPLFTKVTLDGDVHPLKLSDRYPQPKFDGYRLRRFGIGRALLSPFEGLRAAASLGARCKIGGAPDWEQYAADPISPKSGKFMTFIAQFDHPLGGTAYAFLDTENLIATVITQND